MNNLVVDKVIITHDIIDILKDIKKELNNGKLKDIKVIGDDIRVTCPSHKQGLEDNPSCNIYIGSDPKIGYGVFNCFTCGISGPFWVFVGECFDESPEYGKKWLLEHYEDDVIYDIEDNISFEPITLERTRENYLDEKILDNFEAYHPYLAYRKIPREICELFKIKYDSNTNSVVFPVRDIQGRLKYLTRRNISTKSFHIDGNADKSNIFLLNEVLWRGYSHVMIVESQFNALYAWANGFPAVALLGAGTTKDQIDQLNKTPIRHYVLAYDGDAAGRKGAEKFKKLIRKDVFIDDILMPDGIDVNDLTQEQFNEIFNKYNV